MSFSAKLALLLAKLETTQFTDPTPTPAANSILAQNLTVTPLRIESVERNVIQAYFGAAAPIPTLEEGVVEFDVDLVGSGTAGTAPAWGPLIQACAFAEVIVASTSVTYNPVSSSLKTITIYYYDGGTLMKFTGAPGNVTGTLEARALPRLHFRFVGRYIPVTDASIPGTYDYTSWQIPAPSIPANAGTMTIGGYAAKLAAFSFDMGNEISHAQWINLETLGVTDRKASGSISFEAVTVASKDYFAIVRAVTTQALVLTHGIVAGKIITIGAPKMILRDMAPYAFNNFRAYRSATTFVPSAGNDELTIACT
jgi:hypothetical protein